MMRTLKRRLKALEDRQVKPKEGGFFTLDWTGFSEEDQMMFYRARTGQIDWSFVSEEVKEHIGRQILPQHLG
jgi:hypothetical protein